MAAANGGRNDVLDAFRAFAILVVALFHYTVRWIPPLNPVNVYKFDGAFSPYYQLGQFGVEVFFVISGLVITMTIIKSHSVYDFAIRRFARLYPAFLFACIFAYAVDSFGLSIFRVSFLDFLTSLTMDAADLKHHYVEGAFWSLTVEVKFYVLVAVSFAFLRERFWIGIVAVAVLGTVVSFLSGVIADRFFLALFMPFFLVGMAGWFFIFGNKRQEAAICLLVGVVAYVLNCHRLVENLVGDNVRLVAHFAIWLPVVLMMLAVQFGGRLRLGWIAYIGRASYSWYLIHQRLGVTIIHFLKVGTAASDWIAIAVALIATLVLGCVLQHFLERRAQRAILALMHRGRAHALGVAAPSPVAN